MDRIKGSGNILRIDSDKNLKAAMINTRKVLLSGGIVAFPTESFYGLAVDIENKKAIEKLFTLKARDKNNPILILLPQVEDLKKYVKDVPHTALKLINKFWPGGLTMLFEAAEKISPLLTAGTGKIGIRYSSHVVANELARSINRPVTGTSANLSGSPPCTRAEEVFEYFGMDIDLILDNGPTMGGQGSTILDVTVLPCAVLRKGIIPESDIKSEIGCLQPVREFSALP